MQHIPTKLDHGFEYIGGDLSTDFVNTRSGRITGNVHDHVQAYADVVDFVREAGLLGPAEAKRLIGLAAERSDKAAQIHRRAVALREAAFRTFERIIAEKEPARDDVEIIGAEAAEARARSRFMKVGEGFGWDWPEGDDLARPLWPIARAASDLLANNADRALLRECSDDTCAWLFVDRSRNHTRRWCEMETCGNRAKQRRFEQRQKRVAAKAR